MVGGRSHSRERVTRYGEGHTVGSGSHGREWVTR